MTKIFTIGFSGKKPEVFFWHPPLFWQNKNTTEMVVFLFWWESACTNRAEKEFSDLMQQVKEFKEKWLISPEGENVIC